MKQNLPQLLSTGAGIGTNGLLKTQFSRIAGAIFRFCPLPSTSSIEALVINLIERSDFPQDNELFSNLKYGCVLRISIMLENKRRNTVKIVDNFLDQETKFLSDDEFYEYCKSLDSILSKCTRECCRSRKKAEQRIVTLTDYNREWWQWSVGNSLLQIVRKYADDEFYNGVIEEMRDWPSSAPQSIEEVVLPQMSDLMLFNHAPVVESDC